MADPSEDELLLWVQSKTDRPFLEEIAANDSGDDFAKHLAAIQQQLRPNPPLGVMPWLPLEVLQLERCREPDRCSKRGHIKRLLACTIFLRNSAHIRDPKESDADWILKTSPGTLLQLTGSAIALGVLREALGFVQWMLAEHNANLRSFGAFCAVYWLKRVTTEGRLVTRSTRSAGLSESIYTNPER